MLPTRNSGHGCTVQQRLQMFVNLIFSRPIGEHTMSFDIRYYAGQCVLTHDSFLVQFYPVLQHAYRNGPGFIRFF